MQYNLLQLAASPLIALFITFRYYSGKSSEGWGERWGFLPASITAESAQSKIWVHAVSAGEVVAAVPILRELRRLLPTQPILMSVITPAGYEMAMQQAEPYVDGVFYAPFDLPWITRKVVRQLKPLMYISLESELWPNLLHDLKQSGSINIMMNARLSERSSKRSGRFAPWLYRWMLGNMDMLLVQSLADQKRFMKLSKYPDTSKIQILGNSKFDQEINPLPEEELVELKKSLRLPLDAPVLVAGSTRSSEEEAQVITAYGLLLKQFPDLCLIIAPRDIKRAEEITSALHKADLAPVLRSEQQSDSKESRHLILNTIGELAKVYAAATISYVGNSIPPVVKGGGQNILQPLAHGKPVFVGPLIATIRSEYALASEAGVAFQIQNGQELAAKASELMLDSVRLKKISETSVSLIKANQGIARRYAEEIAQLILSHQPG